VAGAFFMENLDGTIIATAAPRMAESFRVQSVDLNVTITVYLVTLAVFIPVSGWVADRFGARTVFAAAIAVFTVASGLCALSGSLGELTAMRVLQGVGGAMMVPVGRLAVLRSTGKADLIKAIAYLTWPALAAPLVAPVLGGVLSTYASWRWIFVVNIPLGVIAFFVTLRTVPQARPGGPRRLDWRGFLWGGVGLGTLLFGTEAVSAGNVNWPRAGAAVAVGSLLIGLAVRHLRRTAEPLVNLRVLRIPTFRVTNVGGSLYRMAIGAVPFLLPLLFQDGFGWSPVKSGVLVIAVFAGNIGIKPLTSPLLRRFGFKRVLIASALLGGVSIAVCGLLRSGTPLPVIIGVLFVSGVARSVAFTAYNTIAFADVAPAELNSANTLWATVNQLAMGLGVALAAVALRLGTPVSHLFGSYRSASAPFTVAFFALSALAFFSIAESVSLPAGAGSSLNARR
jgi:EmrB/QacA subfamily drug resistance transporter